MGGDNVPPNTILRAYGTGPLCLAWLKKGEKGIPVGQSVTALSLAFESFEELVNGLSHRNWGKFASIVRCSSDTAKLDITLSAARESVQ